MTHWYDVTLLRETERGVATLEVTVNMATANGMERALREDGTITANERVILTAHRPDCVCQGPKPAPGQPAAGG